MRELADLQINDYKAPQFAVKEKKIDAIPFAADAQPALATDEGKVAAELEQELLKVSKSASSRSLSEYSSFSPRNSRTSGSRTSSSAEIESSAEATAPLRA